MASRLQATFVFMRYKRRIGGKTIFIAKETTFGSLAVQWAKKEPEKYPAGVSFFDESGELSGELHPEGDATYTVVFDDRDDTLREICEKAAQVHKKILKAGRSDREDASARDYGWGVVYAPHDFGQDGRFQRAGEPDAFWVEFRESFDKLEAKLYELLFSPAPSKNECLLCGPAGTGKSHAVMAVVNSLMRKAHARMEESKEQTGEGGPAEAKRYRVVPILDCRKLVLDFTATVATGLATAFGNDELALDEICQLQTAAQFRSFLSRQSAQVLFVLDQYQYVVEHGNDSLKESLNKLLYGQRALFVTSAGSNEVKELVTKSHKYQEWVQLEPALTEKDMQAWNLVFGTEEVLKEERHRDRLNVLDRNPLLLHAWYTTCKDAGVPVRNIEGKTEEQAVEVLRQAFEAAVAGGVFEGPTRESLPVETIEQAETQSDSPRKRRRFEKGLPGGSEDQGAEGQEAELGWGARVESSAAEVKGGEQKEAQPGGGGREQSGAAELGGGGRENIGVEELGVRKQEQMELGGALQKKFNADNVEREGGRRDDSSQAAPGGMGAGVSKWPPFEKLFEMFLEHKNVSLIYEDLLQGYTDAKKKGKERAKEWNDIHLNLLLSRGQFVRANLSLVNGRHFEFAENRQAARPANSLVRVFLAQVLDDTAGNALVFAETEALGVLTAELSEGKHPVVVGALAERAVIAQLCLGAGKRFLRFPTSGAEATVVEAFETGDEQTLIDKLYKKAREELDRGAGEFLAICKPKSVAYRYIDAIQVYAQWEQGPEKGSQPAKIAGPAESSGPPTGTGSSAVTISRTSTGFTKQKGGKKKKKKALAAAAEQGGTDVEGGGSASALSEVRGIALYINFVQVSLMKFAQHVFSTDGAMHWSYCGRWEPTAVEKTTSVYYGMGYVLPKSRLPEIAETVRMVPGEDLVLRRMLKHKLVEHEQVCLSFEQFSRDLAMVDGWPAIWQDMFK